MSVELLALVEARIGAGVGATQIDGFTFGPLVAALGRELSSELWLGTTAELDRLLVVTSGSGADYIDRVREMLSAYDVDEDTVATVADYALLLPDARVRAEVLEVRDAAEPELTISFETAISRPRLSEILAHFGIPDAGRQAADAIFGQFSSEEASGFTLKFATPTTPPKAFVDLKIQSTTDEIPARATALEATATATGASAAQAKWIRTAFPALSPRAIEEHRLRFGVEGARLIGPLDIGFLRLPVKVPLRILSQFYPEPERSHGTILGALIGTVGVTDDVVNLVRIGLRATEPPAVALLVHAP